MAPRFEHGSGLSVERAFVVHFSTGGGPGRRRFSGRVEHLSSGESARFSSLKGLLASMGRSSSTSSVSHRGSRAAP